MSGATSYIEPEEKVNIPTVYLIDDSIFDLKTYQNRFRELLPSTIKVEGLLVYPKVDDYLPLLQDENTVCIITDQRMKNTGVANYTGIELAKFLRRTNSKLPIYILSSFTEAHDEFGDDEWSVEAIINKGELSNPVEGRTVAARLVRRIDVYQDIKDTREARFDELLKKSLDNKLSEGEETELEALQLQRISPALAIELAHLNQLNQILKAHETIMNRLEHIDGVEGDQKNASKS